METEFVNVFIQKQKDVMVDLLMRTVMLEARVSFAESKLQSLEKLEEQHKITLEDLSKAKTEIDGLQKELRNYKDLIAKQQAAVAAQVAG